jgi:hypothetical protein
MNQAFYAHMNNKRKMKKKKKKEATGFSHQKSKATGFSHQKTKVKQESKDRTPPECVTRMWAQVRKEISVVKL